MANMMLGFNWLHPDLLALVQAAGYLGLAAIVFTETGLFFGFFLPGDSLLFTAGLLASQGLLNIYWLILVLVLAATVGDNVGYWFGRKVGARFFTRPKSLIFRPEHLEKTRAFYAAHGARALLLGRFVPIIRTYVPILAGVGEMNYTQFWRYNVLGALAWAAGVPLIGYFLGAIIPGVEHYLLPIVLLIILVSIWPIFVSMLRSKRG